MDAERTLGVKGTVAPNQFTYALSPEDSKRFAAYGDALLVQLAEAAREHARDEGYTFLGPVSVALEEDESVAAGTFLLGSEIVAAAGGGVVGSLVMEDGRRVEVGKNPLTIGRLPECTITLADTNVSRKHAEVRPEGAGFMLSDLGSTNGTFVNGVRITQHELVDGDVITFGGAAKITFEAS